MCIIELKFYWKKKLIFKIIIDYLIIIRGGGGVYFIDFIYF